MRGRGSTNLDDLIARKFEFGNIHCVTSHEVTIENSEDRLMGNYQEIILFAFKLEDDWFQTDCQIMVGLLVQSVHGL